MSKGIVLGMNGKPMSGQSRKTQVIIRAPDLPDDPVELDRTADHIESLGIATTADAFAVAMCRLLAKTLRRLEQLEPKNQPPDGAA